MLSARTEYARHLVVLGALAIGVLALLLVPAMASADPGAPTSPRPAQEQPAAAEPAGSDAPAAAQDEPAPAAEQPTEPAPPPPAPEPQPEQSTPAPAPPTDPEPAAPLTSGAPASPDAPAEAAPVEETTLVLPAPPSSSSSRAATAADRMLAAAPEPPAAAPDTPVSAPTAPPDDPASSSAPAPATRASADAAAARALPPPRSDLVEALGGVQRMRVGAIAPGDAGGPGPAGTTATDSGDNPFDTLAAPGGPAPAGSSLLAVLASYVIPGGGLPITTLFIFVQLAVILAAFYAPRSGIGERIHALGRLGPRHGYRTVLARPG